jgi:hypothetical protein
MVTFVLVLSGVNTVLDEYTRRSVGKVEITCE